MVTQTYKAILVDGSTQTEPTDVAPGAAAVAIAAIVEPPAPSAALINAPSRADPDASLTEAIRQYNEVIASAKKREAKG